MYKKILVVLTLVLALSLLGAGAALARGETVSSTRPSLAAYERTLRDILSDRSLRARSDIAEDRLESNEARESVKETTTTSPQTFHGDVTAVFPASNQFTMIVRHTKQIITFLVDAATKFVTRTGLKTSLANIQNGMVANVKAKLQSNGLWLATRVSVGNCKFLPKFPLFYQGTITAVGSGNFTMSSSGSSVTIFTDSSTRYYRSSDTCVLTRLFKVPTLTVGQSVRVGGAKLSNGNIHADNVILPK